MLEEKIKILHILPSLQCGGTETWLLHLMENINRSKYQFDFLIRAPERCFYEDRFRKLGSNIYRVIGKVNGRRGPIRYLYGIRTKLITAGPYDVVHCHEGLNSGLYVWLAKNVGIPVRLVHSHSDYMKTHARKSRIDVWNNWIKKKLVKWYATGGFACSSTAASALFGEQWAVDPRWRVLFCGIDIKPFKKQVERIGLRQELGIPSDTFVVGHVGRFDEVKNHRRIVSIFKELIIKKPDAYLLLVGDGTLRPLVEEQARQLGLSERVVFAGIRRDVPELMLGAMDVFLFPSLFEGLGLVLVEAQAAGLPCVISDVIPAEADVIPNIVTRISLACSDEEWAKKILMTSDNKQKHIDMEQFRRFDIEYSAEILAEFYGAVSKVSNDFMHSRNAQR